MQKKINYTYVIALVVSLAIVGWGLASPASFEAAGKSLFATFVTNFGWFYSLAMTSFVVFVIWIGFFSKYKNMRLGPDDSRPEYSNISWFAMLFSAGMGIGLVFWGVAEPLNFFVAPLGADPGTPEAAQFAMNKAFLHWGLHPWANYSVLALALAYMQFRKNKPGLISSVFIPVLGEERVKGPIGITIDVLAIFATLAGVATSLGLGAYQINSGLHFVFPTIIPENNTALIIIVAIVTILFMTSAITGLDKGIKFLSNLNVGISGVVILSVFIVGPTLMMLNVIVESIGGYFQTFAQNTLAIGAFKDGGWYGGWTIFYWAWWIAWAPFSAIFIARISKGRTIKEFVTGVLLVPAFASFLWFGVFGTLGIQTGMEKGLDVVTDAVGSTSTALFKILQHYPFGSAISIVVVILLCTFFVTSADSATFVLGMLSEEGNLNPKTSKKVVWGVLLALLALALMIGSENGLQMLQTVSIVAAFPFAIIMVWGMYALVVALKSENVEKLNKK
ncbi:MAG: BCCT family transporter [Peptostreptococcaceae bacterium]|nr:BCCT family transporter [Peptostreptococcaceae bacterium]